MTGKLNRMWLVRYRTRGMKSEREELVRVIEIVPSGTGMRLEVEREKGSLMHLGSAQLSGVIDTDTGEIVDDINTWCAEVWLEWQNRLCGGVPLRHAIDALPTHGIGQTTSETIARHVRTWQAFWKLLETANRERGARYPNGLRNDDFFLVDVNFPELPRSEDIPALLELNSIEGVAAGKINALVDLIENHAAQRVRKLIDRKFKVLPFSEPESGQLSGTRVAFTGTFHSMSRAEARNIALSAGAHISSAVNEVTYYLIKGKNPSKSKIDLANEYGVIIISENEFIHLCGGKEPLGDG